jgi:hypothetical protein
MNTSVEKLKSLETINILLVGNNPIELGRVLDKIKDIDSRKILIEIAFDLKSILSRLIQFNPTHILIDDNVGKEELRNTVEALSANKKTKDVPITILKNSNYTSSLEVNLILDYVLKQNISSETFITIFKNAAKLKRAKYFLEDAYQKRKHALQGLISH